MFVMGHSYGKIPDAKAFKEGKVCVDSWLEGATNNGGEGRRPRYIHSWETEMNAGAKLAPGSRLTECCSQLGASSCLS